MIRGLLTLAVFIFLLNQAYMFTSPYIKNTMLDGKMTELAKNRGHRSEAQIRAELMKFIYEKDIEIDDGNVMVEKTGAGVHLAARYQTEVSFWNYTRGYPFFPASSDQARLYWNQKQRRF